jgi:hypothetical protein
MKNPRVQAVVSYEPGSGFVFPEGELPPAMPSATGPLEGVVVRRSDVGVPGETPVGLTTQPRPACASA